MMHTADPADDYGPPRRPRVAAKRAREQESRQHYGGGANRTYLMLMATCLLVSAVMNWIGFTVTEKQGKRASHIEAYLRRYLSVGPSISTRNRGGDAPASHRGPDSIGDDEPDVWEMSESGQDGDDDDDDDDDYNIEEGEELVESEYGDNTEDDDDVEESEGNGTEGEGEQEDEEEEEENGNASENEDDEINADTDGPSRPVEDGGPPPDEDGGRGNRAAAVLPDSDENSDEARRPMAIEHGGPPAIDGRRTSSLNHTEHRIGGLSCKKYGGPSDRIAKEMVYWKDIPTDSQLISPLKGADGATRYMTFEPDGGGWNNVRMAMETVVSLAHALGRTLVLPPDQRMYLIGKNGYHASFAHFYHLETLSKEHAGLTIISMEEFLDQEAVTGRLIDKSTRRPSFPPGNRTDWNGESGKGMKVLHEWLRNVALVPQWKPDRCVVAIPSAHGEDATSALEEAHKQIKEEVFHGAADAPVPVGAPLKERMREMLNGRDLCIYHEAMQKESIVHFVSAHKLGLRLLIPFYAFLFFEDPRWDSWNKRFVRDHLRYIDELQCAAARVVHAIRDRARKRQMMSKGVNATAGTISTFMSMHIRRNDFQYKDMFLTAEELYHASKEELIEGSTVFVATDEKERSFFKPLQEHYDLCFLDDFKHLFEGLNENLFGMLDQLVASRGDKFVGTYYSTFTGFINRMRGYHADKAMLKGYENGVIESFFFAPETRRYDMASYEPPIPPYWAREFPLSWRDIDKGIEDIASIGSVKKTKTQTTPAIM